MTRSDKPWESDTQVTAEVTKLKKRGVDRGLNLAFPFAFVFTFFIPVDPVFSEEIEGAFRCDVENIYLIVMEDGSSKQYGGYENSLRKGDSIIFNYSYYRAGTSISRNFTIYTPPSSRPIFRSSAYINKRKADDKELFPNTFFGTSQYGGKGDDILFVSEDSISAEDVGRELELTRYFKNDWHGLLTDGSVQDAIHVTTLNCRHVRDGLEPMVKDLKASGF